MGKCAPSPLRGTTADNLTPPQRIVKKNPPKVVVDEAVEIAEQYVDAVEKRYGKEHAAYAGAIRWLSSLYKQMGRPVDAERLAKRALKICEKLLAAEPEVNALGLPLAYMYLDAENQLLMKCAMKAAGKNEP